LAINKAYSLGGGKAHEKNIFHLFMLLVTTVGHIFIN